MKKIISMTVLAAILASALYQSIPLITNAADDSTFSDAVQDDDADEALMNAFTLIKQFVEEQMEKGDPYFHLDGLYIDSTESRVIVEIGAPYRDIVVSPLVAFLQENDIEEITAIYILDYALEMPPTDPVKGDINYNGCLGLEDAVVMSKSISGDYVLPTEARVAADFNGDGEINTADLTALMNLLAGS